MAEQLRAKFYRRLADSVGWSSYKRKKKLKGPVEKLRRAVGSNRYCEFAQWLQRLSVKGASVPVRFRAMLSSITEQIDRIEIEYHYTLDPSDSYDQREVRKLLEKTRELLELAHQDTAQLAPLFTVMAELNDDLHRKKRCAARPPEPEPVISDTELDRIYRESSEKHAKQERDARLAASRKWLREFCEPEKHNDDDVRRGDRWLSMYLAVQMIDGDITGYGSGIERRPLWSTLPTVEQLAEDYRISQRDAHRVLAAYTNKTHAEPTNKTHAQPGANDEPT